MRQRPRARDERKDEVRGGGGEVRREPERTDEQRDVNDPTADAEKARPKADDRAVDDPAAHRHRVAVLPP